MVTIYKLIRGNGRQIGDIHYNERDAVDSAKLHVADFKESVEILSADVEEVGGVPVGMIDWTTFKVIWA